MVEMVQVMFPQTQQKIQMTESKPPRLKSNVVSVKRQRSGLC
jgi:hypothetical protein